MKTLIAGSRTINSFLALIDAIKASQYQISSVVSGGARGVDKLGERLAEVFELPLYVYPAHWDRYGKRAGYIRNEEMARVAEQAIILWDGKSKGTAQMIKLLKRYQIPYSVFQVHYEDQGDSK